MLTKLLRENREHPFWSVLRNVLTEKGIDYLKSYVAFSSEEGNNNDFGIIITPQKRVLQYNILLADNGKTLNKILEWNDITESYGSSPYNKDIKNCLIIINGLG